MHDGPVDEAKITEGEALVAGSFALHTGLYPHGLQLRLSSINF